MPIKNFLFSCVLLFAAACFFGCEKRGEPVTFADVCRKENHALVAIEGYLRLPTSMNTATGKSGDKISYLLLFVEERNGTGSFLYAHVDGSKSKEPNRIADLPLSYTYNDFQIFTNEGVSVSADDRVLITGELYKETNSCVLKISKIETP